VNTLLAGFRKGWARHRNINVSSRAHYWIRHELGEAATLCEYQLMSLAGDLCEPGEATRCGRCKTALALRSEKATDAR
jgi:hypothetical protein